MLHGFSALPSTASCVAVQRGLAPLRCRSMESAACSRSCSHAASSFSGRVGCYYIPARQLRLAPANASCAPAHAAPVFTGSTHAHGPVEVQAAQARRLQDAIRCNATGTNRRRHWRQRARLVTAAAAAGASGDGARPHDTAQPPEQPLPTPPQQPEAASNSGAGFTAGSAQAVELSRQAATIAATSVTW